MTFILMSTPKSLKNEEPFVPSKAIIVMHFGVPQCVYHHGTCLSYWIDDVGVNDFAKEVVDKEPDGIYVWSGTVKGSTDYWGEHDAWLEGDLRLIIKEEWIDYITDNAPWDREELEEHRIWREKCYQQQHEEQIVACRCDAAHCNIHRETDIQRRELLKRLGMEPYNRETELQTLRRLASVAQHLRKRYSYARDGDVTISGLMELWGAVDAFEKVS